MLSIEVDAPDHLVLLSDYGVWNEILDECIDADGDASKTDPMGNNWERVFQVNLDEREPWGGSNNEDTQACLPYIERSWVRGLKRYILPSAE